MATIKEYLLYYNNVSFQESSFNEMDNILFSELSYLNWEGIINEDKVSLYKAIEQLLIKMTNQELKKEPFFVKGIIENIKIILNGARYQKVMLGNFINIVDQEKQFGALCIYFEPRKVYVSYKGTDNSVIGWKEDFIMSYRFPIESQKYAISYLNNVISWKEQTIYVGGHSKGGNLAMCASMLCKNSIKKRINTVFNNDGPGFLKEEVNLQEYQKLIPKLKTIVPEESVVGMLLYTAPITKVVKSSTKGFKQHDCNTWECFGPYLIEGILSEQSKNFDQAITNWLMKHSKKEREKLVLNLFDILEQSNITIINGLTDLEWNKMISVMKKVKTLDANTKKLYMEILKVLLIPSKKKI